MRVGQGSVAAGILLALLAVLAWRNVTDTDFGIHMSGGRWIAEQRAVPDTDPFTFTVSDHATVAYHWLFQLGLHAVDRIAGVRGLALLRAIMLLATALLLLDVLRVRRSSALAGSLVGLCAILACEWRFGLRPELASWLCGSATLWVVERRRAGRSSPLWLLPLVMLLWANLHVYVVGAAILAIYAAEEAWRRRTLRTPLLAWSAAAMIVTLLNPYGLRGVAYPLVLATRLDGGNLFAQQIGELASPLSLAPDPTRPFTTSVQLSAYRILTLFGAVATVLQLWRRRLVDAAVVALFGGLSLLAVRNVALYAVIATPALASALDRVLGEGAAGPAGDSRRRAGVWLLAATLGYALVSVPRVVSGTFYAGDRRPVRFAAELCRSCLALDTADWLAQSPITGRGLNNLAVGGTLAWRDTRRKIFIDGRNEVTGEAFYAAYQRAMDPVHWQRTQRLYALEYVVLAHRGDARAMALAGFLRADPAWRLVYLDGSGAVFVRADGPNGGIPAAGLPDPLSGDERQRLLARVSVQASRSARLRRWLWSGEPPPAALHGLGSFLLAVDRLDAAERPLLAAAAASPGFWEPHLDLGVLYQRLGMRGAALAAFRNAHALAPDHPDLAGLEDAPAR
jgi:hypothetical protein